MPPDLVLSTTDEAVHLHGISGREGVYIIYVQLDGGSLAIEEQIYALSVSIGTTVEVNAQ